MIGRAFSNWTRRWCRRLRGSERGQAARPGADAFVTSANSYLTVSGRYEDQESGLIYNANLDYDACIARLFKATNSAREPFGHRSR